STGDPILAKQRARNLLHNYYGPEGGSGGNHEPLSPSRSEFPTIHHHQEKLSIDSPYFDVDSYLNQLMKSSSQKLDGTLSQLQDSLLVISQLSISLTKPTPSSRTRTSPKDKEREEEGRKTCNTTTLSISPSRKADKQGTSEPSSSQQNSNSSTSPQPPNIGKLGSTGDPILAKQRARNLLRDYYGLEGGSGGNHEPLSPSSGSNAYFNQLVGNSSLKSLLSTANELMSEIKDLDRQRQSLVYNHHHELVEASETIDKMKSSSQKLDGTLSQLQDSLSVISQLSTSLTEPTPSSKTRTSPKDKEGEEEGRKTSNSNKFEGGLHLSALLSLPIILKGLLIDNKNRSAADQLWGQWEPALRSFEEAGVIGVNQIGNDCRELLRNSKSSNPS
ncbi:hypothetical protein PSTT_15050, partial [Puccinia striiformis]